MNWETFIAVITWCVTIIAAVAAFMCVFEAFEGNHPRHRRNYLTCTLIGVLFAVFGLAVIGGMGWYPQ